MSEDSGTPSRRSTRVKKLSLRAIETIQGQFDDLTVATPTKRTRRRTTQTPSIREQSPEIAPNQPEIEKPTIIHENVVGGHEIFSIPTKKSTNLMLLKAAQIQEQNLKTPHSVRAKIQKNIQAKVLEENELSDGDYSGSESDFESSSSGTESTSEDETPRPIPKKAALAPPKSVKQAPKSRYTIQTEDYFTNHATKKIITSNHTLDKLETPRLMQDQLKSLLQGVAPAHSAPGAQLAAAHSDHFGKWMCLLHENFNVLLFGLGSKTRVMDAFRGEHLRTEPTIVVNGFFPPITVRKVLEAVYQLLELAEMPASVFEACEAIEKEFGRMPDTHLYILVYNIDAMRAGKSQAVFAKLAAVRNIHLIASIDHINAPLIWDHQKLSNFNFTWWDVTSFERYVQETAFESSMMVQRSGHLALSSLRNVFSSLPSNSKGIYLVLVKYQLEHAKNQYYEGFAYNDLYAACREAFLVSASLALRAQLNEFVDHKLAKYRRAADGTEYVVVPIQNSLLQQFLDEHLT